MVREESTTPIYLSGMADIDEDCTSTSNTLKELKDKQDVEKQISRFSIFPMKVRMTKLSLSPHIEERF